MNGLYGRTCKNDMKSICALVKTFRGEEFVKPMIYSIFDFVEKIVFVNSETSWIGGKGNTCKKEIKEMQEHIDRTNKEKSCNIITDKIVSLDFDTTDQIAQCEQRCD